jgi:hypothetical protein
MKKSILIATILFIGLYANVVAGVKPGCYVKTSDEVYFGQKVKVGLLYTKIIAEDGTTVKVRNVEVKSFMNGSGLFRLLPIADADPDTPEFGMMQYIACRSGYTLYSYAYYADRTPVQEYFVYENEKLHVRIDQKNAPTILNYFGIDSF